jgi:type IV secretory pathway VirJ component
MYTRRLCIAAAVIAAIPAGATIATAASIATPPSASARITVRAAADSDDLTDLPLTVVPAKGSADRLAVLLTGDGGWAGIDKELADSLSSHGTPVVVLDSRAYFSTQRDPDGAAHDLGRILRHYLRTLGKAQVLLIGYSRGADVLPFMASRLPADLESRVTLMAFLGPAHNANFKFHMIDLISNHSRKDDLMTVPEIEKLRGKRILCFYGADEKDSACRALGSSFATAYEMPGGHHFGKKYGEIATRILDAAKMEAGAGG